MFAFAGSNNENLNAFLESLKEVARKDPLSLSRFGTVISHDDGWGFVDASDGYINHYKSSNPIFESFIPQMQGDKILVHARKASKEEPRGSLNAHPYHNSSDLFDFYLAHNGTIDKTKIGKDFSKDYLENHTDSEVFLKIVKSLNGNPLERLTEAVKKVYETEAMKGSLNIFLLSINRKNREQEIFIYGDDVEYNEYSKLYSIKGDHFSAVFSSSIILAQKFPENLKKEALTPRVIYSMDESGIAEIQKILFS